MGDLVSDRAVADSFVERAIRVDFSGASSVPYPCVSTIAAMSAGAGLGNDLKAVFDNLESVVVSRSAELQTIAATFAQVDAQLAAGLK